MQTCAYKDRRTNDAVDCTQTIWILATNFGSGVIESYYETRLEKIDEKHRHTADLRPLQAELKQAYRTRFGVGDSCDFVGGMSFY